MERLIGVDVGGTFTDLVWHDEESGALRVGKEPTSASAPEEGVLDAVAVTLRPDEIGAARLFLHGTTVGLNALLERRGATVGLICSEGFRDVLEVRRGDRDNPYDLFWAPPPPLVPRRRRVPIGGRIAADGTVVRPLDLAGIADAIAIFAAEQVDAVAVAFINAYANPEHELAAEEELRRLGFTGHVSLSHRVSGEYREYERTSTTVVDAFVRRRMGPYLDRLRGGLDGLGFGGDPLITRSGGGAMTFDQALDRPFETVLSGPVAGAVATAALARELALPLAIGADVGGTSFDTCLISHGQLPLLYQGSVIGMPLQTPWVDVRSIGAGGGSIAYVDEGGLLRVGPQSAGSAPGPACYGRGGTEPTVTDAAVALGMLPDALAGGIRVDREQAVAALEPLRAALGFDSLEETAYGIIRIAAASMADAIRSITVELGVDPREAAIVAFGGAGPLFGTFLADELEIGTVVVPALAGNFSAWGLLHSDLAQTASRTRVVRLSDESLGEVAELAGELFAELAERGADGPGALHELHLDMRYAGQEHTLTVPTPLLDGRIVADAATVAGIFGEGYERAFGHTMDGALEIVTVRASAALRREPPSMSQTASAAPGEATRVPAWSLAAGAPMEFLLVDRDTLAAGEELSGPAIVYEPTTTTYLDAGFHASAHTSGALVIRREAT